MKSEIRHLKVAALLLAGCGGGGGGGLGQDTKPLEAVCVERREAVPAEGWICGENRTVECDTHEGANPDYIHVVAPTPPADGEPACPGAPLEVSDPGPYSPGTYTIEVRDPDAAPTDPAMCTSTLTVVDTTPPRATAHSIALWPPNHALHTIGIADCVTIEDACDAEVSVHFTWAASNEPTNSTGDGNTDEDIVGLGCDSVQVRAERKGNGEGRVYTLGWRAVDDSGNTTEGTCQVAIAHDQGNRARTPAPGEDHRVAAPADCAPPADDDGPGRVTEPGDPQPGDDRPDNF
jgi:hypothetical protein